MKVSGLFPGVAGTKIPPRWGRDNFFGAKVKRFFLGSDFGFSGIGPVGSFHRSGSIMYLDVDGLIVPGFQ